MMKLVYHDYYCMQYLYYRLGGMIGSSRTDLEDLLLPWSLHPYLKCKRWIEMIFDSVTLCDEIHNKSKGQRSIQFLINVEINPYF